MDQIKIGFVRLANYYRSPMAEAIFDTPAEADGRAHFFKVSSAGTKDWDVGLRPDPRALRLLIENGYSLSLVSHMPTFLRFLRVNLRFLGR